MASEKSSRNISERATGPELLDGETLPFISRERNDLVTKPAPYVFITDLKKYILHLLDENDR